eukprot:COSAG02_NODE_969_length_15565_cov_9.614833_12_plen_75_part_00
MPLKPLDESNHSQLPQETPSTAVCCREAELQHPLVGVACRFILGALQPTDYFIVRLIRYLVDGAVASGHRLQHG